MRRKIVFNDNWKFSKENNPTDFAPITLPHTWNAEDGQDGGNDYYRGKCWYVKEFRVPEITFLDEVWLEFRGVAMTAEVYLNGKKLASHAGGYSTFRVNLTPEIMEKNILTVAVDNSYTREVYPQRADFTFYGGIYRDVYLMVVPKRHFALEEYGTLGLKATPEVKEDVAEISLLAEIFGECDEQQKESVLFSVVAQDGSTITQEVPISDGKASGMIRIEQVHLWDGVEDPYLYTVTAQLICEGEVTDEVSTKIGCRTFTVDPERGFFLNGRSYPLCGVARHQDRRGVGNALTQEMHREDMEMIKELGANTIRLAHYQHDQYFYDLCDEMGMIVWAEIPYITEHMPEARENTISQMTELITQNYHHPSIICWGLSNEITVTGGVTQDLMENHRMLNDLCHRMDATRLTTMANVFILDSEEDIVTLPDIRSYNLYYGWYVGEKEENDAWFDEFHAKHPDVAMGLSEYGADAIICYQTATPEKGDYTEEYQAIYHEHMLKMWKERPYIWAMHVWNMFDFGADSRGDVGEPGVNHKGLVTFDRKIKKDAFYIYKAYLSKEPFVHLCGRRYIDRTEEVTEVKVYSNQTEVTLKVDGVVMEPKQGDKIFIFKVPIRGTHTIEAIAGDGITDCIQIRKVAELNPSYTINCENVVNWFDMEAGCHVL